jgi:uncharacterized protein (DUF2141 family)
LAKNRFPAPEYWALVVLACTAPNATAASQTVSFNAPRVYRGADPAIVADFNGDGIPDLAVTSGLPYPHTPAYVTVLLANGDGSFRPTVNNALGSGQVRAMAAADFNGDGKMDLAVANGTDVAILLGNGDGTFQPAAEYPVGGLSTFVAVADFNGDGAPDLAVANAETNSAPTSIAIGDFNGDGTPDLAVASQGRPEQRVHGSLSVLLGAGDGSFQPAVTYGMGDYHSIVAADFNGDGKLDLAAADYYQQVVAVMLGNGDGTFQPAVNSDEGQAVRWLAVGDFNGDGVLDLATNTGWILTGQGNGSFTRTASFALPPHCDSVLVADFNGDGYQDLAPASGSELYIVLGSGHTTFQRAVTNTVPNSPWSVAAGDFNGDGNVDLAVANTAAVSVLLGNGDGSFGEPVSYSAGKLPSAVITGDFNGDGKLDLAVAGSGEPCCYRAMVSILLGNGDGTFQPPLTFTVGNFRTTIAAGDFN